MEWTARFLSSNKRAVEELHYTIYVNIYIYTLYVADLGSVILV